MAPSNQDPGEKHHSLLAQAAVAANSFKTIAPGARSTGFRTAALSYRALEDGSTNRIGEDFLLNSRLHRASRESETSIASYFSDSAVVMLSMQGKQEFDQAAPVALPRGVPLSMSFDKTLARRRSKRLYTGDPLPLEYLATLLRSAGGVSGHARIKLKEGGECQYNFRTVPSAGGLYPVDIYLAALNVVSLERRVYRYSSTCDGLLPLEHQADLSDVLAAFCAPETSISISRAQVIFFLVGQPWKTMRKYGNRGMRFLFLEAGAIAQTINLTIAALGLGSVDCASVYEDEIHEAFGVDGLFRSLLHTLIVGYPS
jgi:SagB-type dehydrogenase family enzyme